MHFFNSTMANVGIFMGVCVGLARAMDEQIEVKAAIFTDI